MNFEALRSEFDEAFRGFVDEFYQEDNPINAVCNYVLAGEGKRIRAILTLLSAKAVGGSYQTAMPSAMAVEMIHAYSLVHDDLPCMDNDNLRRGRPTAHVKFDEASALLAGDALLTDAMALFSRTDLAKNLNESQRLKILQELSTAAGSQGMVKGQILDLFWTKRRDARLEDLKQIHELKTGALIGAACASGGISSGKATNAQIESLRQIGILIGHTFQILDDLLDDSHTSGKSAGKDLAMEKLCYLKLMGADEARKMAETYTQKAVSLITEFGDQGCDLEAFVLTLLSRKK